jgi:hypothetical protein
MKRAAPHPFDPANGSPLAWPWDTCDTQLMPTSMNPDLAINERAGTLGAGLSVTAGTPTDTTECFICTQLAAGTDHQQGARNGNNVRHTQA